MDEFEETYSDSRRTKAEKNKKSKAKKHDWLVALSTAQLILACIGVALLFAVSKSSPVTFVALKNEFETFMQTDMSVHEVAGRIYSVFVPEEKTTEAVDENQSAAGGEDIETYEATENVCFAPFDTTVDMVMPTQGEITSRFGYRYHPITGKFGIHNGTDIAAPEGTPIYAAFNGRVEEIGFNSVRGNYILLSHGGDTQTLYLHCSEIVAPEGAVVRQGEIIAKVGNTGYSTGPHLHFSILIGGKYCNPEWLINDL